MADYSIPLQVQQPNMVGALGNLAQTANALQQYQLGNIKLQQEAQANLERKNVIQLVQNDPDFKPDATGIIPMDRAMPKLMQAAPQTFNTYAQSMLTSNQAMTTLNNQMLSLGQAGLQDLGQVVQSSIGKPKSEVASAVEQWVQANPQGRKVADQFISSLGQANTQDQVDILARHAALRANTLGEQLAATTPPAYERATGQQSYLVAAPGRAGITGIPAGQVLPGTLAQQQVPPTATTMVGGRPQYVGARPSQGPGEPIAAGPALGQPELTTGGAGVINQHYSGLQADAAHASMFEGIARNIQNLAPKAITGTEADKLAFANGLLAQILPGQTPPDNLKTATDLLLKNMSMLNLQGDTATNFKTSITQMAQPHGSMSPTAMKDAASQLIGQARMKQSLASFFTPDFNYSMATGDQSHYLAKLQAVNPLTDARAWEFSSLSPEDQKRFRARLSEKDDEELGKKYKALKAFGLIQ